MQKSRYPLAILFSLISFVIFTDSYSQTNPSETEYKKNADQFYKQAENAAWIQKNSLEAIDYLNKAIEINPKMSDAYGLRGRIYYDMHQYTKAYEDIQKELEFGHYSWVYDVTGDIIYNLNKNLGSKVFPEKTIEARVTSWSTQKAGKERSVGHIEVALKNGTNASIEVSDRYTVWEGDYSIEKVETGDTAIVTYFVFNNHMYAKYVKISSIEKEENKKEAEEKLRAQQNGITVTGKIEGIGRASNPYDPEDLGLVVLLPDGKSENNISDYITIVIAKETDVDPSKILSDKNLKTSATITYYVFKNRNIAKSINISDAIYVNKNSQMIYIPK